MSATADTLIARRAGAMCIAAGRHGDGADWPCARHLALARWLLGIPSSAVAPASSGAAARLHSGGAGGAAATHVAPALHRKSPSVAGGADGAWLVPPVRVGPAVPHPEAKGGA